MNKIAKRALMIAPVVLVVSSVIIFLAITLPRYYSKKVDAHEQSSTETDSATNNDKDDVNSLGIKIFPDLDQAQYYKYIEINNGFPQITDNLISHFISDVLAKMQYTDGQVYWGYEFADETLRNDVNITFKLHPSGFGVLKNEISKTYHLSILKA